LDLDEIFTTNTLVYVKSPVLRALAVVIDQRKGFQASTGTIRLLDKILIAFTSLLLQCGVIPAYAILKVFIDYKSFRAAVLRENEHLRRLIEDIQSVVLPKSYYRGVVFELSNIDSAD